MNKFQTYFITNCMSFTVLILFFSVLSLFDFVPVNAATIFVLFSMTTCVAVLMYFLDKLPIKNKLMVRFLDILVIVGVVFGMGAITGVIPFTLGYILMVILLILGVYFTVTAILLLKTKADVETINKRIGALKRKVVQHDKDNRSGRAL